MNSDFNGSNGTGNGIGSKAAWIFALLLTALNVTAAPISSVISSDYAGSLYACRVNAWERVRPTHKALEIECELPNNGQTTGMSVVNGCPSELTLVPLTEWTGASESEKAFFVKHGRSWVQEDGAVVTSFWVGPPNKFPESWIRINSYAASGINVSVGSFADLLPGGSGGTNMTWNLTQVVPSTVPYNDCRPAVVEPKPEFVCTWLGCF